MKLRAVSLLLATTLVFGNILPKTVIYTNAENVSDNETIETNMNPDEYLDVMENAGIPLIDATASIEITQSTTCPVSADAEQYDPREYNNRMTSVKNQGSYGLCWDFATQACAEQYLINTGKATSDIDLSESYFAYYIWKNYVASSDATWSEYLKNSGYNTLYYREHINADDYLPIALEENFKYEDILSMDDLAEEDLDNTYDYKINKCYYVEDYSVDKVDTVKSMIVNYGAVVGTYYDSGTTGTDNYYNNLSSSGEQDYNYYAPVEESINHGITIVGWDDEYSASNFKETPSGNGAWLCKNSWGTGRGLGSGYFWMSYYNQDNLGDTYTAISLVDKNASSSKVNKFYEVTYGNILDLSADYPTVDLSKCRYKFDNLTCLNPTSDGLKAVNYGKATIEVYDSDRYKLGTASVTVVGDADSYKLNREDTEVSYKAGYIPSTSFSVLAKLDGMKVTPKLESSNPEVVEVSDSSYVIKDFGTATIKATYCDEYKTNGMQLEKSFTITVKELCSSINLSLDSSAIYEGETIKITAQTTPENVDLTYSSSNSSIAEVDSTGVITAVSAGYATITVKANDGSNSTSRISIIINRKVGTTTEQSTTEQPSENQSTTTEQPSGGQSTTTEQPSGGQSTTTEQPSGGQSTTTEQPSGGQSTTTEQPSGGQSTTTEQPSGGQSTTTEQPSGGQSTTTEQPSGGQSTTTEQSSAGQSTTEQPSGGQSTVETIEKESGNIINTNTSSANNGFIGTIINNQLPQSNVINNKTQETKQTAQTASTGRYVFNVIQGNVYYTIDTLNHTAFARRVSDVRKKAYEIPDYISYKGEKITVDKISSGAFKNCKNVTRIVIGKNVKNIEKNVFAGCKQLKTITIKSTKLSAATVKAGAFKGIKKGTSIKVPKKKLKAYKKLFPSKGLSSKVGITV